MALEIERRFLLKRIPKDLIAIKFLSIVQYYDKENGIRYRETQDRGTLERKWEKIKKSTLGFGINEEVDLPITEEVFYKEIALLKWKPRISKRRIVYKFIDYPQTFEVDIFEDMALVICEVELKETYELIVFPPEIQKEIIKEITGEIRFSNMHLAE